MLLCINNIALIMSNSEVTCQLFEFFFKIYINKNNIYILFLI